MEERGDGLTGTGAAREETARERRRRAEVSLRPNMAGERRRGEYGEDVQGQERQLYIIPCQVGKIVQFVYLFPPSSS